MRASAFFLFVLVAGSTTAHAASCTDAYGVCTSEARNRGARTSTPEDICKGAYAKCQQTGIWYSPVTGRVVKNLTRN